MNTQANDQQIIPIAEHSPLWVAVNALKEIQYVYSGAGRSYEDICVVKSITQKALKSLGVWNMSLDEFRQRSK